LNDRCYHGGVTNNITTIPVVDIAVGDVLATGNRADGAVVKAVRRMRNARTPRVTVTALRPEGWQWFTLRYDIDATIAVTK